ncbi:hypothetical protein EDB19DRAFT_584597 [Suillus lakei]|nr:hypothetical protein EDB19DRAFT_584597 [Suillus lakei]
METADQGVKCPAIHYGNNQHPNIHNNLNPPNETTDPPQPQTPSGLYPHLLLARLSSFINHSRPGNDVANELQEPHTPSGLRPHALFGRLSSFIKRSRPRNDEANEPHTPQRPPTPSGSRSGAFIGRLSSLLHSSSDTNHEEIELPQRPRQTTSSRCSPHVVEVAAMRDKQTLYVARPAERPIDRVKRIKNPNWRVRVVLFICCVTPATDEEGHRTT